MLEIMISIIISLFITIPICVVWAKGVDDKKKEDENGNDDL